MANDRRYWIGGARLALGGLLLGLMTACDPPRDLDQSSTSADATSASADLASESSAEAHGGPAAKSKLPVSGDVVLIGGWSSGNKSTATAEFFDPTTLKFTNTGSMAVAEGAGAAALLPGPQILVAGGFGGKSKFSKKTVSQSITGAATDNLQTYDPTTGKFTAASVPLSMLRFGATATMLTTGEVLIAGGADSAGNPTDTAEVFDPGTGTTTATVHPMNSPRMFHTATLLDNGTVLLAGGGTDNVGDLTDTADIYDPGTNDFTATTGAMNSKRAAHAAVLMTAGTLAGKVLITGGVYGNSSGLSALSSAESYDPAGKTFTSENSMNDTRAFHTATVLESGDVLIVGGFTSFFSTINGTAGSLSSLFGSNLSSAEILDQTSLVFTCVSGTGFGGGACNAAMKIGRGGHTATLLVGGALDGQVLIAGGLGAKKPNSKAKELKEAELFNPTGSVFTKTHNLKKARGLHAAVTLE
jgi:Galactose oxidase, central domain/Kelch motif